MERVIISLQWEGLRTSPGKNSYLGDLNFSEGKDFLSARIVHQVIIFYLLMRETDTFTTSTTITLEAIFLSEE